MKKILLLIIALFAFLSVLPAQNITQKKADEIVFERMWQEIPPYIIYAKMEIQEQGVTITTAADEVIELDYACWMYYTNNADNVCRYLIVNESNGNLLEVNVKNDFGPSNLPEWRIVTSVIALKFDETVVVPISNNELTVSFDDVSDRRSPDICFTGGIADITLTITDLENISEEINLRIYGCYDYETHGLDSIILQGMDVNILGYKFLLLELSPPYGLSWGGDSNKNNYIAKIIVTKL